MKGWYGNGSLAAAWYTMAVLAAAYTISFLDRQILVLLVDPIRRDVGLTDTGVSLLTGPAFALAYAIMGVFMGRAADLWSRKKVVILGVGIWGLMTAGCGLARTFGELFVGRFGVGIGEAALTPVAYSMVPDLFPHGRQARAMGIFVIGAFAGSGLSLVCGGWIIGEFSNVSSIAVPVIGVLHTWQLELVSVGAGTLLLLIPLSWILDPPPARVAVYEREPVGQRFIDVLGYLWRERHGYFAIFVGVPLTNAFAYGVLAWLPTYFIRVRGWAPSEAGKILGTLALLSGVIGCLSGGWLADRWRRLGVVDATVRATAFAVVVTIPLPAVVVFASRTSLAMVAVALLFFMMAFIVPLVPTGLQSVTPRHMRAQVSALFLLAVNLVGIGLGPMLIAVATDYVFHDPNAVGSSIALMGSITNAASGLILFAGLGAFRHAVLARSVVTPPVLMSE